MNRILPGSDCHLRVRFIVPDLKRVLPFYVIFAALFFQPPVSEAGTIRVSFLTDGGVLKDTLGILKEQGCPKDSLDGLCRAVQRYNATPLELNLTSFPRPTNGVHAFDSASKLVAALPHHLADSMHPYQINCFDTVILLTFDQMRTQLRPDDKAGPFFVPNTTTNNGFRISPVATARYAFMLAYPDWYAEATKGIFIPSRSDARMSLNAALFRCQDLSGSVSEENLRDGVIDVLRTSWRHLDLKFPKNFEVILCHEVTLPKRFFVTAHAGILIPRPGGYTYIEKAGGSGPFVRLDFANLSELRIWLSGMFKGAEKLGYTHHFVTFNDTRIELLD